MGHATRVGNQARARRDREASLLGTAWWDFTLWSLQRGQVYSRRSHRTTRQIDRKHTTLTGQVAGIDATVVGFRSPSTERQSDTQARAIRASLFKWSEQILEVVTARQAATFVVNFDQHTLSAGTHGRCDRAAGRAEFESVLKEIEHD